MEEAAAGKARLPTVDSLTDGTMRRLSRVINRRGSLMISCFCLSNVWFNPNMKDLRGSIS